MAKPDYARAEQFLPWNAERLVFGMSVEPHWLNGGDRFWYRSQRPDATRVVMVDPRRRTCEPAFAHARLVAALSAATGAALTEAESEGTRSPDGQWLAFARDGNLLVRATASGDEFALTHDGVPDHPYATPLPSPLAGAGIPERAPRQPMLAVQWSPDSRRLLSYRIDARGAHPYHWLQSKPLDGTRRPRLHTYAYPLPGDENVPMAELLVFDVARRSIQPLQTGALPILYYGGPLRDGWTWWDPSSARVYVLARDRDCQALRLVELDATTGAPRTLVEELSQTAIDAHLTSAGKPNVRVLDHGATVLWFSQRDGWGHLYLYDARSGELIRQLTRGDWAVADVLFVNEAERWIAFTAVGREADRDPYFELVYRVYLDSAELQLLTPEDATHRATFSPSGAVFIDTWSRVDQPPTTILRANDGTPILELERADIEPLLARGWTPPARFCVKARDGITDIYGILLRPSNFHPSVPFGVVVVFLAGPQTNRAPASFAGYTSPSHQHPSHAARGFWHAQALAELGFAVVMIDGLGMPFRSKAFHDQSFRQVGDGGIADHVHALRQLAARHPYLDLERVGVYGHSAGGYASTHALLCFPDFYKVAVSSAGNHDHRLDKASWIERYMGLPVGEHYHTQANSTLAHQLEGKLLLIHGDMDENVHIASTLQLVDALIDANKDFDLLILPNRSHACTDDPYFIRKRWDYFVRHLLGAQPPEGYRLTALEAGRME